MDVQLVAHQRRCVHAAGPRAAARARRAPQVAWPGLCRADGGRDKSEDVPILMMCWLSTRVPLAGGLRLLRGPPTPRQLSLIVPVAHLAQHVHRTGGALVRTPGKAHTVAATAGELVHRGQGRVVQPHDAHGTSGSRVVGDNLQAAHIATTQHKQAPVLAGGYWRWASHRRAANGSIVNVAHVCKCGSVQDEK